MAARSREERADLEAKVARLLPWGWPERLAIAGLGVTVAGTLLPWGRAASGGAMQLIEHHQFGWVGLCVVVLALVVPARLTERPATRGPSTAIVAAAGLAAPLSLLVEAEPGDVLPLLVPGRAAIALGGVTLVVAAIAMERRAGAWGGPAAAPPGVRTDEARFAHAVALVRRTSWGSALGGAAVALVAAGAASVLGPASVGRSTPAPGATDVIRSGVGELGGARSASVAVAVLAATAAFVVLGGRRAAPVVVLTGATVVALVAALAIDVPPDRTPVPVAGVLLALTGVAGAIVEVVRSWRSAPGPGTAARAQRLVRPEPDPVDLAELSIAVGRRARWDATRWMALAALGVGAAAVSTTLFWRAGAEQREHIGGPIALWVLVLIGAAAVVAGRFRTQGDPTAAAGVTLGVGGALSVVAWWQLTAGQAGSAPWLSLVGALAAASAASVPLRRLEGLPTPGGGTPQRADRDPTVAPSISLKGSTSGTGGH